MPSQKPWPSRCRRRGRAQRAELLRPPAHAAWTLAVEDFVELAEIDPIHYQRSYYLAPRGEEHEHAYGLLREAMKEAGLAGIAALVMRNKEYLAAIRARDEVLILSTMYFTGEKHPDSGVKAEGHGYRQGKESKTRTRRNDGYG
ncbi:Ku protein [Phytoactinopolyspora mesophila]|uniref:Ku domain-containing protein n=1 Tax=Phytoactinopolyspora mesophila TaxID=2650750 RepID=A0A7K3LY21_9ACTN|nr:Ku protein [Phytoactinopolyspora mesophila]NDL55905.1 hypothetical protein [Phytoactinopolyspora mesophila]